MSLAIEVKTLRDDVAPAMRQLHDGVRPGAINPIVGRSARNTIRDHLFATNSTHANRLGGTRTNFYTAAGRATSFKIVGDSVIVSIASVGIAQRYFGGTIKPRTAKFLTIPARAEAHGKRAGEFNDLQVLFGRNGPYALAKRAASLITVGRRNAQGGRTIGRRGEQGGEVMFWLVKEVTQRPDPTVLPSQEQLQGGVQRDVMAYLQLLAKRTGGAN